MKLTPQSSDLNKNHKDKMICWPIGEVTFSALMQIQRLRAKDKFKDAYALMNEWNI
tara:strand:+ start:3020 stop:3187 length:168 start_codon:yes stop_codon:yes gene_type:complete